MPSLIHHARNPVVLNIIEFDLDRGEDVFLSYTHGLKHGPIIQRTGRGSPFMEHLYPDYPGQTTTHPEGLRLRSWLIQEDLRSADLTRVRHLLSAIGASGAPPEVERVLQQYENEIPKLSAHDVEFIRSYPDHEIIGQQGCGDLTMNLWNVAYLNSPLAWRGEPVLLYPHEEPLSNRIYSCLIKWKPADQIPRLTIEDVRFSDNAPSNHHRVWVERAGHWTPHGDEVEFAVSNQQLIREGQIVQVSRITHQFSDLRHLLQLPNLNPPETLPGVASDPGRPRYYYGRSTPDDIWFGEAQLLDDFNLQRAAMTGPIFLSRLHDGLGVSIEQIRGAMRLMDYAEQTDARAALTPGQYRFIPEDDTRVEVYLKRNKYAWTMLGLNGAGNRLLALACEGNPAIWQGHVLEEAAQTLRNEGAHNALLIDEGADVFQVAQLGHGGAKARVAGGSVLDITIPLKRTRLRATFIFARKKS